MKKLILMVLLFPLFSPAGEKEILINEQKLNAFNIGLSVGKICHGKSSIGIMILHDKLTGLNDRELITKYHGLDPENVLKFINNGIFVPNKLSDAIYNECVEIYTPLIKEKLK